MAPVWPQRSAVARLIAAVRFPKRSASSTVKVQPVAAESARQMFSRRVRDVKMQMPSESSKARRPRSPATYLATCSPSNGLMRAGWPTSVGCTGLPVSIVAVEDVHVSSISSQRARWSWPRGGALDALRQHVAEPFATADHLQQAARALDVAPLELEAQLRAGDVALFLALHDPAAEPAPLVHVDARLVALGVEPGDPVAIGRADRPAAAGPALVLGLVDDLAFLVA